MKKIYKFHLKNKKFVKVKASDQLEASEFVSKQARIVSNLFGDSEFELDQLIGIDEDIPDHWRANQRCEFFEPKDYKG